MWHTMGERKDVSAMTITAEQVEKLRQQTGVSCEEARVALESSQGDLLEAVIWLERQGKISPPSGGAYSTRPGGGVGEALTVLEDRRSGGGADSGWKRLWAAITDLFSRSLHNHFEVVRHDSVLLSIPVLLLVVLLLAAFWVVFWVVVPLAVVGLFFGYRYHFSGADLGKESVNHVMDAVAKTAEDVKRNVKNNLRR